MGQNAWSMMRGLISPLLKFCETSILSILKAKIKELMVYLSQNGLAYFILVRNRAKELAELLSDSDKIRTERKKAKAARTKYTGVGSDDGGFGGTGKKYGGFGSDDLSYGSYSGQVYGIISRN